jgi:long-chain acyl-CoA synthetase
VYAASEAFPVITYDPTIDPRPVPGSAGKVVSGAQMRIVDENGADVPPGTPGEALWKAPALFLGYWADDITTTAALTTDGWYRTKDLVRVDENGYVFVVGRLSDMIIRGGSNVSPSEVEAVIREHPSIAAVAVVGVHDDTYGQAVVAAVQPTNPDSFEPGTITAYCRDRLAGYKVPTQIVIVKEFPLNRRTAKIDRSRLARELSTLERTP